MELTVPYGWIAENEEPVIEFYRDVFGWVGMPYELFGQTNLFFAADESAEQFILVAESDRPMSAPGFDHLGILCDSREDVDELERTCLAYAERDPRVEVIPYQDIAGEPLVLNGVRTSGSSITRAFYVRYLLPIRFDVQTIEYEPGGAPAKRWHFGCD